MNRRGQGTHLFSDHAASAIAGALMLMFASKPAIAQIPEEVRTEFHRWASAPQRVLPLKPPPDSSVEWLFSRMDAPDYFLDLRRAPESVSAWLQSSRDHWNGFNTLQFATGRAFDLVYYVSPVTSACRPPDHPAP